MGYVIYILMAAGTVRVFLADSTTTEWPKKSDDCFSKGTKDSTRSAHGADEKVTKCTFIYLQLCHPVFRFGMT